MTSVTVYSTGPECQRCRLTYLALERAGIEFRTIELSEPGSSDAREFVTSELGYSEAPVVVVDDEPEHHWSGFRPDHIQRLANHNSIQPRSRTDESPWKELSWMTSLSR